MSLFAITMWVVGVIVVVAFAELSSRRIFGRNTRRLMEILRDRTHELERFMSLIEKNRVSGYSSVEQLQRDHARKLYGLQELQRYRKQEYRIVIWLALLSAIGFLVAYLALKPVLANVESDRFSPSEAAQIITAVGGAGLAIGTGVAAILKAFALMLHARADVIRARYGISSGEKNDTPEAGDPSAFLG
jgi:hypothetical protein